MTKLTLAILMAFATAGAASASTYLVVIPTPATSSSPIEVTLTSGTLSGASVGKQYSVDLNPLLTVVGDPRFDSSKVMWSLLQGPDELSVVNGTLMGTLTETGTHPVRVRASYLNKTGEQVYQVIAAEITVTLTGIVAPDGNVNQAYSLDLTSGLSVTGDHDYKPGLESWALSSGSLPNGLSFNNGVLSGTPSKAGEFSLTITTSYAGKQATTPIALTINNVIVQNNGYRAWSDGTYAESCNAYLQGETLYRYAGATGDGIYRIDVDGAGALTPVDVQCDMTTDGGGWTTVQRRVDDSVDFYRTWAAYADGFGNAATNYWLGNNRIAVLTSTGSQLRIDMQRYTGDTAYASYSAFKVHPASDNYRLNTSLKWEGGTSGDSLTYHTGSLFTTKDVDNDSASENCAVSFHGAWWYHSCHLSNLNGGYLNGPHESYADGMSWDTLAGHYESLTRTEMKVR